MAVMGELSSTGNQAIPAQTGSKLHDAETEAAPSLRDPLLSEEARSDDLVPPRRRFELRPLPALD
jgi:hypothetical protein